MQNIVLIKFLLLSVVLMSSTITQADHTMAHIAAEQVDKYLKTDWENISKKEINFRLNWHSLYNHCQKMALMVNIDDESAKDGGITREEIELMTRSRMRSARIYRDWGKGENLASYWFRVDVSIMAQTERNPVFSISVSFDRPMLYPYWIENNSVHPKARFPYKASWQITNGIGVGDSSFILQSISGYVDRFIDSYLEVNDKYCS